MKKVFALGDVSFQHRQQIAEQARLLEGDVLSNRNLKYLRSFAERKLKIIITFRDLRGLLEKMGVISKPKEETKIFQPSEA